MSKRLMRVQSLLAKVESTEGTDATPSGANAIRLAAPVSLEVGADAQNHREDAVTEALGHLGPIAPSAKTCAVTIRWRARGFGAAYSASNLPEADPLFQACALSQTVVTTGGSESVTYDVLSTGQKSCTIYIYEDGKLHKITAARGNMSVSAPAGQPAVFTFTMRGIYNAATDTSLVTGTYSGATAEPLFKGSSSLSYNSVTSLICRSYELDLGNSIAPRLSANATDGLAGFHVTNRASTARFVVEDPLVATTDFEADWAAATARALYVTVGSTQYNRVKVQCDKFTVTGPTYGEDNGIIVATVPGIVSVEGTKKVSVLFD